MARNSNNKAIKVLITLFMLFFICVSGYEYFQYGSVFNNTEHYRKVYAEALEQRNNEEFSQAFATLERISPRYEAFDAVLYQQAQCAAKVGDEASVQKRLKSLINKYPNSYLYVPAKYDLAKSFLRSGDKTSASAAFENIINSHKDTDYETGSYYYLGDLNSENNKNTAIKYWKKYIEQSQDGRFSLDCVNNIITSNQTLTDADNYYIGLVYINNQKQDEALKYLQKTSIDKSWYHIAKIYISKKNYLKAKEYISIGLKKYTKNYKKDDLANLLYSFVAIAPSAKNAWNDLGLLATNNTEVEDIILFNKAKYVSDIQAQILYKKIVDLYVKGDYSSEALKKLFWHQYNLKNFSIAKDLAGKHVSLFSNTKSAPEMNYWLGKIYEREGNDALAIKIYTRILTKYPDDYYAMRAYGRINYLTKGVDYGWNFSIKGELEETDFELNLPYSYSDIKTRFGATLAELLLVEDFATIEYFHDFNEPFIESWIAYKKGLKSTATTIARNAMEEYEDKPARTDEKWKFIYPCYFAEEINKYATRNKITPYLLISLIREESYFNPLALSKSNAVGLTQILPSTAREVAERKGYGRINEFLLFNPETNIKFGASYFAQIKKQLEDNNLYAVAAYNGGAGAVSTWINRYPTSDLDEFVEKIPYSETQSYVKKVFRSYWNYIRLYME